MPGQTWSYATSRSSLRFYLCLMNIFMQQFKNTDALLPEILMITKNPAIWVDKSILANNLWSRYFPDTVYVKDKIVRSFIFWLFPEKCIDKISLIFLKKSIWDEVWSLSAYFKANQNFSAQYTCHFFLFLDFYCYAKFQKHLIHRFLEKLVTDVLADGQMDGWTFG